MEKNLLLAVILHQVHDNKKMFDSLFHFWFVDLIGSSDKLVLSAYDRSPTMAVNPEGTVCQSRDSAWSGLRGTKGVVYKGKYYYEATVSDEGLCRVGWALNEVKIKLFSNLLLLIHNILRVVKGFFRSGY